MFRQVLLAVVFVSVCRACTYNPNCKSTYIMDVANGDACSAANAFQSCVSAMLAGCTSEQAAQPNFSEDVTAASTAILSHCAPPPPPPGGGGPPPPPNTNDGAPPAPPNTNEGGTPAPPPPPQPTAPQQSTDCQLNVACESTYVTAVSSGDACGAATTFVNCASTNADQCGDNIPSTVEAALNYARQQKAEKCNEPPAPGVPVCAQICIQYKDAAELLIAQGNTSYACSKLTQYSTCLQNQHSSCDTTVARQEAESLLAVCTDVGNCTTQYNACNTGLTSLQQSNSVCDIWNLCKKIDFSVCGANLNQNFDSQCANSPTKAPGNDDDNGSPTAGARFVLTFFGFVLFFMLQQ